MKGIEDEQTKGVRYHSGNAGLEKDAKLLRTFLPQNKAQTSKILAKQFFRRFLDLYRNPQERCL